MDIKNTLADLEPKSVFHFFEELCNIPHGSYNLEKISGYLVKFAKDRNIEVVQDEFLNVVMYQPATPGYEKEPTVIIQGHMDMVAVQEPSAGINMEKEGLRVLHDDVNIWADQTSLGGDDGIAVAYALAILDDRTIPHPALEVVITTNEEVGMDGAIGIDPALIHGNRMLNIDSEEEGILTVGCAGGVKIQSNLPLKECKIALEEGGVKSFELTISGLNGGHSGTMIHLGRANANIILGRVLNRINKVLGKSASLCLISAEGGEKSNAIPNSSKACFLIVDSQLPESSSNYSGNASLILKDLDALVASYTEALKREFLMKDDDLTIKLKEISLKELLTNDRPAGELSSENEFSVISEESTRNCIALLLSEPDGVQALNGKIKGLVDTSLNMGIMKLNRMSKTFETTYEVRSALKEAKADLGDRVVMIAKQFGADCEILGDYPEWEFKSQSVLQQKMVSIYQEMYGEKPVVDIIHAGLECGVFAQKIKDLDAVSFGPDIHDIHTTKEHLDIASVGRVWTYILKILAVKDCDLEKA